MKQVYYILNDLNETIAIFTEEYFAREYLAYMDMDINNCRIGMLADNIFRFDEHDAQYYTLEDSHINKRRCIECNKFKAFSEIEDNGYCFFIDEAVNGLQQACNLFEECR